MRTRDLPTKYPNEPDGTRFIACTEFGFLEYSIQVKSERYYYTFAPEMWPHIKAMVLHMDGWMKEHPDAKSVVTTPTISGHVTTVDAAIAPIDQKHNAWSKEIADRLEKAIKALKNIKEMEGMNDGKVG